MPYINGKEELSSYDAAQRRYPGLSLPRAHPENWPLEPGALLWRWERPTVPTCSPEEMLVKRQNEIRVIAETFYKQPVVADDGIVWNGGFDSAVAIKGVADMAEFVGSDSVEIFDMENNSHTVDLRACNLIAAMIGAEYQAKFSAKQAAMRALSAIDLEADDAIDQIKAVRLEHFLSSSDN